MADGSDFSDLLKLTTEVAAIGGELPIGVKKAITRTAYDVRKDWSAALQSSDVPAAGSTLRYEVEAGKESAEATIANSEGTARLQGYVKASEYGSVTVTPKGYAFAAVQANAADLERGLAIAGENAIRRALGV